MNLFDIPDVYNTYLWPLLSWNDLLRIRRVCKTGRNIVDDYIQTNSQRIPEIEINEDSRSLEDFLHLKFLLQPSKIYVNNKTTGALMFENLAESFDIFLNRHALNITKLRLYSLSHVPLCKEREFLESLENLKVLHVTNWIYMPLVYDSAYNDLKPKPRVEKFPSVYRQLTEVNIGMLDSWRDPQNRRGVLGFSTDFADYQLCPQMTSITVPFCSTNQSLDSYALLHGLPPQLLTLRLFFRMFQNYIVDEAVPGVLQHHNLKMVSFEHCHYPENERHLNLQRMIEKLASSAFIEPLQDVSQIPGFTLEMVNAAWFTEVSESLPNDAGRCIKSLVNLHPAAIEFGGLDNLERLDITSSKSCVLAYRGGKFERPLQYQTAESPQLATRPAWDKLKTLNITVDSGDLYDASGYMEEPSTGELETSWFWPITVDHLFEFLFRDVSTESLTELNVDFHQYVDFAWLPTEEATADIVNSCPNIKKLSLKGWISTDKSFTTFWTGLPFLEEVTLKRCRFLRDSGFIGEDTTDPVFLGLTKLKKLSLLELDEMPRITDTLFTDVLTRMPLKELTLSSSAPISSVTVRGVRGLLNGTFSQSIEIFRFKGWSISNCSTESFETLAKEFRSSRML